MVATRHSRLDRDDVWSQSLSLDGIFSVKSAYSYLMRGLPDAGAPHGDTLQAASRIWKSWAPSKGIVFSWQLLLDRLPTRSNLVRRGVPLPERDLVCVLCSVSSESVVHRFIICPAVLPVWYQASRWLGWEFVIPIGLAQLSKAFTGLGRGKRVRFSSGLTCYYLDHLGVQEQPYFLWWHSP